MRLRPYRYVAAIVVAAMLAGCAASQQQQAFNTVRTKTHTAVTPVPLTIPQVSTWWMPRFEANKARLAQGNVDMLWVGDSITNGWDNTGKAVWDQYYANRNAVNMGFGWDRTEHVLWRIENTDFSKVSPKLAVVMIGTNNSDGDAYSAEEIADGIIAICDQLHTKLPEMKILLLAIFPRGAGPSPQREKIATASKLASRIADGKTIFYLDISNQFLNPDGSLSRDIFPDLLHPNLEGYRIWARSIEPTVAKLMGE